VDFEHLDAHADAFKNFDVGYCCLGTPRFQSTAVSINFRIKYNVHVDHFQYTSKVCPRGAQPGRYRCFATATLSLPS